MNTRQRDESHAPAYLVVLLVTLGIGYFMLSRVVSGDVRLVFLLFSALLLVVGLSLRPTLPAAFLVAQVPFQAMLTARYGLMGNLLTAAAIAAFFLARRRDSPIRSTLGTPLQVILAIFFLGVLLSAIIVPFDQRLLLSVLQKIALLFIVAVLADSFARGRTRTLIWTIVLAASAMYLISAIDFYLGARFLNAVLGTEFSGILNLPEPQREEILYGMPGLGKFGPNRFTFIGVMPGILALLLVTERPVRIATMIGVAAFFVLFFGVIASGSRSGLIALVASALFVFVSLSRGRFRVLFLILLVIMALVVIFQFLPLQNTAYGRLALTEQYEQYERTRFRTFGTDVGEARRFYWAEGLRMFKEHPLLGVGLDRFDDQFRLDNPTYFTGAHNPHNSLIQLLSEGGLVVGTPFLVVVALTAGTLARAYRSASRAEKMWIAGFAGAAIGMAVSASFNTYVFERYFWVPVAFAVGIQMRRRLAGVDRPIGKGNRRLAYRSVPHAT